MTPHGARTAASRTGRILVVDDDDELRKALERTLRHAGYDVVSAGDVTDALHLIETAPPHVVVTDLRLPERDGIELLRIVREQRPGIEVLLITAHASIERAVEAMRLGAYDFVEKPVHRDRLLFTVEKALEKQSLAAENERLRARLGEREALDRFVGASEAAQTVKRLLAQAAATDMPVLLLGESGTGKEVAADVLHDLGTRRRGPLVKVSCAAIPEHLLESELFGYERGAFSGAVHAKPGRFELAHGGTLFLDEIGDMSPPMQAKLLRVLQDGHVQRLGGTRDIHVDTRIVSATNIDIAAALRDGRFRGDLYHRLNVVEITLPPLRDRFDDIPLLVRHLVQMHGGRRMPAIDTIEPAVYERLQEHRWPGNVRELENVVLRALAMAPGTVIASDHVRFSTHMTAPAAARDGLTIPHAATLSEAQDALIENALRRCHDDKEHAARVLGISVRTIYRWARERRTLTGESSS